MATPKKRITRGKFVALPGGAGSIKIERNGAVLFKPAKKKKPAARKANPRTRTAPKAKQPKRRVLRSMATWVRTQIGAPAPRQARRRTKKATRKGGRR